MHRIDLRAAQTEKNIPKPNGYDTNFHIGKEELNSKNTESKELIAKQKQVMGIAYGPAKSIMTTAFMLWMSGSSIQIFSLTMIGMALFNPITGIMNINQTFGKFENEGIDLKIPKLIFLALQLLSVGVALYKCSLMGLLPVTSADWTHYVPFRESMESSGVYI